MSARLSSRASRVWMAAPGFRDRLETIRDRLLASPRFRAFAAAFPLTRPVARRRARALFDLVAGFVYSQTLAACVQLDLFAILAKTPLTNDELAERLKLPPASAARLLAAAASLRLVEHRRGERYGLGPLGAAMLGNPGIAAMIRHHDFLYADLADPVALLRRETSKTALGGYWPYATAEDAARLKPEQVAAYSDLMAASQPMVAAEILAAYKIGKHRHLLDIGGGDGAFLSSVAKQAPGLKLALFDLPAVAERATARFARESLSARAVAYGGDVRADAPPLGADIVSLVRVIHDHEDDTALAFLAFARRALPAGGALLLAEPIAGTPGAEPVGDAYFGFYLLAMGSGRARSFADLKSLLAQSGFENIRAVPTRTPLVTSLIIATARRL